MCLCMDNVTCKFKTHNKVHKVHYLKIVTIVTILKANLGNYYLIWNKTNFLLRIV